MPDPVPNVTYRPAFDDTAYVELRAAIDWQQRSVTVYGKTYPQPRLTRWYGPIGYTYSGLAWPADPLPPVLRALAEKTSAAVGVELNSVLCNLYRDGRDCVSWHADDEEGMGATIASLSYGATRTFKLRPAGAGRSPRHTSYDLEHGSLLVMWPGVQRDWQHCIPRTARPVGERINLTFRRV